MDPVFRVGGGVKSWVFVRVGADGGEGVGVVEGGGFCACGEVGGYEVVEGESGEMGG